MARDLQRSSTCSVDRGLYVLRYVSSDSNDVAPVAFARAAPGSEKFLRFVDAPGVPPGSLSRPGAGLVVCSDDYAKIEITVKASESSRVLDAKFALELLAKGTDPNAAAKVARLPMDADVRDSPSKPAGSTGSAGLDILAHVSRRGDVVVAPGEWIAGPDAPTPIEGVQIKCRGAEVAVSAQFMNTTQPGVWSPWWAAGDFVGSRQQASPLTGLRLKLVGREAVRFELDVEAMFLGTPLQRHNGAEVMLGTSNGFDLLVGLKLSLRPKLNREGPAVPKPSRVRVFRSDKADLVNS